MKQKITRRLFTRLALSLPLVGAGTLVSATGQDTSFDVPADQPPDGEEEVRRFLGQHESFMEPLRAMDLPNTLAPFFVVLAPPMNEPDEVTHD